MQDLLEILEGLQEKNISDVYIHSNKKLIVKSQDKFFEAQEISQETIKHFINTHFSKIQEQKIYEGIEQDISIKTQKYFYRIHAFLSQNLPALIVRFLPQKIWEILSYQEFFAIKELLDKKGLLLIAGATGSGKTSSANALLDFINTHFPKHIICIEDPIEFFHQNKQSFFTYREVGKDTQNFHSGILSAMRQDPDVIFVGELRDKEAILSALLAAQTGHLLIATIHAKDCTNALMRLLNADKEKLDDIAESLLAIITQQKLGYKDFIFEILLANGAIKNLIKEQKFHQIQNQIFLSQAEGMVSFQKSLELAKQRKENAK